MDFVNPFTVLILEGWGRGGRLKFKAAEIWGLALPYSTILSWTLQVTH